MNRYNSEYRAKEKEIKIHNRKKLEYILGRCKSSCQIDVSTYAYVYTYDFISRNVYDFCKLASLR